jgi:hypothetical protein
MSSPSSASLVRPKHYSIITKTPPLYESIWLETRIKSLNSLIFWQPGWTTVFFFSFLENANDDACQANDVMCLTGLHSVEWDYDYAGMELERLEDIPWE